MTYSTHLHRQQTRDFCRPASVALPSRVHVVVAAHGLASRPGARCTRRQRLLAVALVAGLATVAGADPARAQASPRPPQSASPSASPSPAFEVMDPATALTPSAQERRAVRGHTLPETVAAPELVWLETVARSLPVDPAQALTPAERPEWTRALAVPELEIPWSRTLVRLLEHMKDDRRGREATAGACYADSVATGRSWRGPWPPAARRDCWPTRPWRAAGSSPRRAAPATAPGASGCCDRGRPADGDGGRLLDGRSS